MKIVLTFLLIFTVFADFSSASCCDAEVVANCDSYSMCSDSDIHSDDAKHAGNNQESEHCHCHVGHMHSGLLTLATYSVNPVIKNIFNEFSIYQSNYLNDFHSEINRPPIS